MAENVGIQPFYKINASYTDYLQKSNQLTYYKRDNKIISEKRLILTFPAVSGKTARRQLKEQDGVV